MQKEAATYSYTLKDIPEPIWRQARAKAMIQGTNLTAVIVQLVKEWLNASQG